MAKRYETARMYELGQLGVVTLGQHFSRCDGNSGSVGDKGDGTPQAPGFETCTQVKGG